MGGSGPDHFAPHGVGFLADSVEALRVVEEIADTGGDGFGIAEGDKNAAVVGEQFPGMPVGGGDDGFAGAENVSERAGGDLGFVEIGGEVNVGGADEFFEVVSGDEAVVEDDVIFDAVVIGEALEGEAVAFALASDELGMGGAEDEIDDVGMLADDFGQGLDDVFDAFAGTEEAEGEEDFAAFDAELGLVEAGVHEGHVGDAVGDDVEFGLGHLVGFEQDFSAFLSHDDEAVAAADEFVHHFALGGVGVAQDGVEGGDDGHADLLEEGEQVAAGGTAVDAELVLDGEDVGVVEVEEIGGATVGVEVFFEEFEADAGWVVVALDPVVDCADEAVGFRSGGGDGLAEVVGEGGDAAESGQVICQEGDAPWQRGSFQYRRLLNAATPSDDDRLGGNSNRGFAGGD